MTTDTVLSAVTFIACFYLVLGLAVFFSLRRRIIDAAERLSLADESLAVAYESLDLELRLLRARMSKKATKHLRQKVSPANLTASQDTQKGPNGTELGGSQG